MPDEIDTAERWHRRAEEVRTLADLMSEPDARRAMLVVAANYDRLAYKAKLRKESGSSGSKI